MSFWTDIRDTVESAAVVAGNYVLPGSGLVTSNLASSGSQSQLGSGLGQLAMLGSGVAGGVAGNLSNYGKFYDAAGNFLTGTESSAQQFINADIQQLIGQGYTPEQAASLANASFSAGPVGGAAATMPGGTTDWSKYLSAGLSSAGGLLSAGLQANAARQAAQTVADANLSSNQLLSRINEQTMARSQPFYQAALTALPAYAQGVMPGGNLVTAPTLNQLQMDPGYGFRFDQGMKGLNASMAAKGLGVSGLGIKGAINYGQGAGTQEYQNAYNRFIANQDTQRNALGNLVGFSTPANAAMTASSTNYGNAATNLASNTAVTTGNANMSGQSAYGNALAGAGSAFANAASPNPTNQMLSAWISKQLGA